MKIRPKNWEEFQHYKDRDPLWIKLHKKLLDNYEFQALPVASRALAPMLWLLASEDKEGVINAEERKLAFRLRTTPEDIRTSLKPLIDHEFFLVVHADSVPIASAEHADSLETQVRDKEEEKEKPPAVAAKRISYSEGFEEFWKAYPTNGNMSKKRAFVAWKKLSPDQQTMAIQALPGFKAYIQENKGWYRVKHADGWLSDEKFEGFMAARVIELTPEQIAINIARREAMYGPKTHKATA